MRKRRKRILNFSSWIQSLYIGIEIMRWKMNDDCLIRRKEKYQTREKKFRYQMDDVYEEVKFASVDDECSS
jgi:hypothetical protein